jgi:hypothetical protein
MLKVDLKLVVMLNYYKKIITLKMIARADLKHIWSILKYIDSFSWEYCIKSTFQLGLVSKSLKILSQHG